MAQTANNNLLPLREFDGYKVSEKDADVRGWLVVSEDGVKVGEVKELIVDRSAMKVRYLDVSLNKDLFDRKVERRVLVPLGLVVVDPEDKRVRLDRTPVSEILAVPPYAPGPINRDYELSVRRTLSDSLSESPEERDAAFYEHEHFEDRGFTTRRQESGHIHQS